jgi:tRNA-2-methylthio-N6-dimethylallyladenosine synthase
MSRELIEAIASLDKVCHHICLPLQSGDDWILNKMNRNYTYREYHTLVDDLRTAIPDISLSTDIIVGFPGENVEQFDNTLKALQEIHFDSVHVACYSPRPETLAARSFEDNVHGTEKKARLHKIEQLQKSILQENNSALLQTVVQVLIEGRQGSKWFGRTYHDKLVFTESDENIQGCVVDTCIESATPWSLKGKILYS